MIEFDINTGKRAGDISPRDPNLLCHGWQVWDKEPARELRLVMDDRDLSKYEGVEGVTIIEGVDAINEVISKVFKPRYAKMKVVKVK